MSKRCLDVALENTAWGWCRLTVGLDGLEGLFQPLLFCDLIQDIACAVGLCNLVTEES